MRKFSSSRTPRKERVELQIRNKTPDAFFLCRTDAYYVCHPGHKRVVDLCSTKRPVDASTCSPPA